MATRTRLPAYRRRSSMTLLGTGMISLAIIAGAMIARVKEKPPSLAPATIVAQFDTVTVPVPAEFIPAGTKFQDIKLRSVSFPRHQLPAGALQDITGLAQATTIAPIPAGLPLFKENFSLSGQPNNPVVERIPNGMRAMTIRVDATSAVEGWAGSGAVVDVLLIEKNKTTVIAEKVKILSAERSVSPIDGEASPNIPSTVTLLVSQDDCLKINTAIPLGKIAFALRSTKDEDDWSNRTFTSDKIRSAGSIGDKMMARGSVTGFVSIRDPNSKKSYALSDGKWILTETKPEGFLVGRE